MTQRSSGSVTYLEALKPMIDGWPFSVRGHSATAVQDIILFEGLKDTDVPASVVLGAKGELIAQVQPSHALSVINSHLQEMTGWLTPGLVKLVEEAVVSGNQPLEATNEPATTITGLKELLPKVEDHSRIQVYNPLTKNLVLTWARMRTIGLTIELPTEIRHMLCCMVVGRMRYILSR